MTSDKKISADREPGSRARQGSGETDQPQWANGLRQLYDSVVEEDLPDSFKDLLSKLDDKA